jgi:fluoroacetyl-CoA thioesterase
MAEPASSTLTFQVSASDTATAVGSGSLEVLGTPRLLAWAEAASCAAVEPLLASSETTVGTRVSLEHRAPSRVGEEIRVSATVAHRDGRLLRFEVVAVDSADQTVGHGQVTRVVVDAERFMARFLD